MDMPTKLSLKDFQVILKVIPSFNFFQYFFSLLAIGTLSVFCLLFSKIL